MCSVPKVDTTKIKEQLNKNNVLFSNQEVAKGTGEKTGNKRTVSSLRVPMKNKTGATGINTAETTSGLNIPV